MADFTQKQLFIMAKALEHYYYSCGKAYRTGDNHNVHTTSEIMPVRRALVDVYSQNLGDGDPLVIEGAGEEEHNLEVDRFYRVVLQGHRLDGQRVKLSHVKADTDLGRTRAWVINRILEVLEVPPSALVHCR